MTGPRDRLPWMDTVRALAVALVVVHHCIEHVSASRGTSLHGLVEADDAIDPFRIPTLMFLSGMLLARSLRKEPVRFLLGKFGRIGWPYLLWSFAVLGLLAGTARINGADSGGVQPGDFLRVFYDPPTYLWYLAYLLVFYVVGLALAGRADLRSGLVVVAMAGAFALGGHEQWQRLVFLFAFFLLGDLVARHATILEEALRSWAILAGALVLAVVSAVAAARGAEVRYQPAWAIGAAGGLLVLVWVGQVGMYSRVGRWSARYGRESLVFYVTHYVGLRIMYDLLHGAGVDNPWILLVGTVAAGFAVGFGFLALVARWPRAEFLFQLPLAARAVPARWTSGLS